MDVVDADVDVILFPWPSWVMAPYLFVVVGVAEVAMWIPPRLRNTFNVKEAAIFIILIGIVY